MIRNIGKTDKIIRLSIASIILILYILKLIPDTVAIILGVVSLILVLTSTIHFCPIYALFKINTNKKES